MAILFETKDTADAEIQKALQATISDANQEFAPLKYEGAYPTKGFGVAPLGPRHVGISNDFWQMTITGSYADWINVTLGNNVYVIVTGIMNLSVDPQASAIQISANGQTMPVLHIESLYADTEVARGWFDEPIVVRPNNNLTVQAVGRGAGTERLGLLGYVVAKRSYLIDTTP